MRAVIAFTKDPSYRLDKCDIAFAFYYNPVQILMNHGLRFGRIKTGFEERVGSKDSSLNLEYFVPYIFKRFPQRKTSNRARQKTTQTCSFIPEQKRYNTILTRPYLITVK